MDKIEMGDEVSFILRSGAGKGLDARVHGVVTGVDFSEDGEVDAAMVTEVHASSIWGNSEAMAGKIHSVAAKDLEKERLSTWARRKYDQLQSNERPRTPERRAER